MSRLTRAAYIAALLALYALAAYFDAPSSLARQVEPHGHRPQAASVRQVAFALSVRPVDPGGRHA